MMIDIEAPVSTPCDICFVNIENIVKPADFSNFELFFLSKKTFYKIGYLGK